MQKRCRRRHFDPSTNPILLPPGPVADRDLLDLRLREYMAFDALAIWQADRLDLRALLVSAATARELAAMGYGNDELHDLALVDHILAGAKALPAGSIGVPASGLQQVRWLLQFHDGQRAAATRWDYHQALARVRRKPSRFGLSLTLP